jgi:hypothetical protein
MASSMQTRLVTNSSVGPKANVTQVKFAPKPAATPNVGTRFLGFLMCALRAPAF